jgi:hypothetical protein
MAYPSAKNAERVGHLQFCHYALDPSRPCGSLRMTSRAEKGRPNLERTTLGRDTRRTGMSALTHLLADYEEMAVALAVDLAVLADGERGVGCA